MAFSGSSQPSDREAPSADQTPRRETRHVVPVISFSIAVVLSLPQRTIRGRLWDISRSGACLLLPAQPDLKAGQEGPMELHHPNGGESIQTICRLLWVDDQRNAAYAGATFLDAVSFEGTFLAMLVSRSNRHGVAGQGPRPSLWDLS
jgi:hypothetical protein